MNTPASAKLLQVDEKSELLKKEEKERFHTVTAKLLYLCKWCRPDIETAVSFFVLEYRIQLSRIEKVETYPWIYIWYFRHDKNYKL